jgi:hypothetical protein
MDAFALVRGGTPTVKETAVSGLGRDISLAMETGAFRMELRVPASLDFSRYR